jgi:hypothetical protein
MAVATVYLQPTHVDPMAEGDRLRDSLEFSALERCANPPHEKEGYADRGGDRENDRQP